MLDHTIEMIQGLSDTERANIIQHISQIEGNAEFVAIYPSHSALLAAKQRIYQFNEDVSPVISWDYKGYEAGQAANGLLYVNAWVSEDQHHALVLLLRIGCR